MKSSVEGVLLVLALLVASASLTFFFIDRQRVVAGSTRAICEKIHGLDDALEHVLQNAIAPSLADRKSRAETQRFLDRQLRILRAADCTPTP